MVSQVVFFVSFTQYLLVVLVTDVETCLLLIKSVDKRYILHCLVIVLYTSLALKNA